MIMYLLFTSAPPTRVNLLTELVGADYVWLNYHPLNTTERIIHYLLTFTSSPNQTLAPKTMIKQRVKITGLQNNTLYTASIQAFNPTGAGPKVSINVTTVNISGKKCFIATILNNIFYSTF